MKEDPKIQTQELILNATLTLVVEVGFKGTTIAQISKRARLSPGVIYYHFSSKDEILHQLFADAEQLFVDTISSGNPLEMPILDCYRQMWLNTYRFGIENPKRLIYIESYQNSIYYRGRTSNIRENFLKKMQAKTRESIERDELKDLPIEAIFVLVFRPAMELSKLQLAGIDFLSEVSVEEIASSICRSLLK